jgi:hypothetical protein
VIVHARVASLLAEIIHTRGLRLEDIPVPHSSRVRLLSGNTDYLLSTLVSMASALGYDVVVNLRERR